MSLIEEALRRVQDPTASGQTAPPKTPHKDAQPQTPPAPAHSWTTEPQSAAAGARPPAAHSSAPYALIAVAGAILALTATLLVGGALWMMRTVRTSNGIPKAQERTHTAPAATASSAAPEHPAVEPEPAAVVVAQASATASQPIIQTLKAAIAPLLSEAPAKPQDGLRLTGIVEGTGEPYAVINGEIVAVGERVGQFSLVRIHDGAAVLRRDDGTDTIVRVAR